MDGREIQDHIHEWCSSSTKAIRQLEGFLEAPFIINETYRESGLKLLTRLKRVQEILLDATDDLEKCHIMSAQEIQDAKNSIQLVRNYMKMKIELSIPFQNGFFPGRSIQLNRFPYETGSALESLRHKQVEKEVKSTTGSFCIASSIIDVCDTLKIHPIYALQVEANLIHDRLVTSCLATVNDHQNICLIFHLSHVQKSLCIDDHELQSHRENLLHADEGRSEDSHHSGRPSTVPRHLITSLDLGTELTVICNIPIKDRERLSAIKERLLSCLKTQRGTLDDPVIEELQRIAPDLDKIFTENEEKVTFECHTYCNFKRVPHTFQEVMGAVREFKRMSNRKSYHELPNSQGQGPSTKQLSVTKVNHRKSNQSLLGRLIGMPTDIPECFKESGLLPLQSNGLRAAIQSVDQTGVKETISASREHQMTYKGIVELLHEALLSYKEVTLELKNFLESQTRIRIVDLERGNILKREVENSQKQLKGIIRGLDFTDMPPEQKTKFLTESNLPMKVKQYIEEITLKLPDGPDLDFFMFGKTGHGKSDTGNSILGHNVFSISDSTTSQTSRCEVGYRKVDGRVLKVVDTPGFQDTRTGDEKITYDMAQGDFNLAVASCPGGFHALLLFWKYAERMTSHEVKAIEMLKQVWGNDILKNYGVVVVTCGDNFKDTHSENSFEAWCKEQRGDMKTVFEECQYRCVLFDNKTKDKKEKKRQLCNLVACVDNLPNKEEPFKNDHFTEGLKLCKTLFESKFNMEYESHRQLYLISVKIKELLKDEKTCFDETVVAEVKAEIDKVIIKQSSNPAVSSLKSQFLALKDKIGEILNTGQYIPIDQQVVGNFEKAFKAFEKELQIEIIENAASELRKMYPASCFPANSQVIVIPATRKTMEELKVGDKVLVRDKSGHLVYDTVYMFGHCDPLSSTEFLVFETRHQQLVVTKDHLVFCNRNGSELSLPARQIQRGDGLFTLNGEGLALEQVLGITCQTKKGLYAPFTNSGTLIVDDALVSCYVGILTHAKAHKLLMPMRTLYQISPSILKFVNGKERGTVIPPWAKLYLRWKMGH